MKKAVQLFAEIMRNALINFFAAIIKFLDPDAEIIFKN
jgi:hypothetical protein